MKPTNKNKHTFFNGMIDLSVAIKTFNWGLVDFLVDVCIVITAAIWGCVYYPSILKPLFLWIGVGIIILFFLMTFTVILRRLYYGWEAVKYQRRQSYTERFRNNARNTKQSKD